MIPHTKYCYQGGTIDLYSARFFQTPTLVAVYRGCKVNENLSPCAIQAAASFRWYKIPTSLCCPHWNLRVSRLDFDVLNRFPSCFKISLRAQTALLELCAPQLRIAKTATVRQSGQSLGFYLLIQSKNIIIV